MESKEQSSSDKKPFKFTHESYFLEGPHSRLKDLGFVLKVFKEFIKGFRTLHFVGPCVLVFGSARLKEDTPEYQLAREVGKQIANIGFGVMTGGGPGIMEAANRGAKEAGGMSVGCNIKLPHEQSANPYLDHEVTFTHFFVRKVLMFKYSYAFIVMPGGIGTMDEMFEALTLIQTGKVKGFPVILMGKEYWAHLMEMLNKMLEAGTISPADLKLFMVTDDIDEAMNLIKRFATDKPWMLQKEAPKPLKFLGEKVFFWR